MRTAISIIFYTMAFVLIGTVAIAFSFQLFEVDQMVTVLRQFQSDLQMRFIIGVSGLLFILMSFVSAQVLTGKIQREKTIAFSNPNGPVTVTLSAVEDLVRRIAHQMSEIKEGRADVKATKRGIDICMRIVLRAEVNIPEFTARLQEMITTRIQEVFGLDEEISVRIHVAKIVGIEDKSKKKAEKQQAEEIHVPPYQGINL